MITNTTATWVPRWKMGIQESSSHNTNYCYLIHFDAVKQYYHVQNDV